MEGGYPVLVERLRGGCSALSARAARAALATDVGHALRAARAHARAYADAKRAQGFVDFDDLIQRTVALLATPGIGAWIGYKLDQVTDHVLVDEAQDTNREQWEIVKALVAEFWAEPPEADGRLRTFFTVGDYKQAIYGFQGTDPRYYGAARGEFADRAQMAGRTLTELSLVSSFRSTPPVLDVVDALIEDLGPGAMGVETTEPHKSAAGGPGTVTLWPPVRVTEGADDENGGDGQGGAAADVTGEEGWIPTATRLLAAQIARQVREWLSGPDPLPMRGGPLRPGQVMILVRKRRDLAALLVARLLNEGVPVAGVDRLRLAAPLVVKDCLAAIRFVLQPDDDLNLASLLVSPIMGWTQEELYAVAHPPRSHSLWRALRETAAPAGTQMLREMLRIGDYVSPYVFLETLLSGTIDARKRLLTRLGNDAGDAVDELLNAALQFEGEGVATLQGFIAWFDQGEGEIVRDPGGMPDAVRVMTVHAAKGLEAPLVILADATSDPDAAQDHDFQWLLDETIAPLPLFRPRQAERQLVASLRDAVMVSDELGKRENWRLLYVAMTRAAERLVIAGSLTASKKTVPPSSWHGAVERAMRRLGAVEVADRVWGETLNYGAFPEATPTKNAIVPVVLPARPDWLDRAARPEARPPRPLAPSSIGVDHVADPPGSTSNEVLQQVAERGKLLHALFERLPDVAPADRRARALAWLEHAGGVDDPVLRETLASTVLDIIDSPDFAPLFGTDGLAEVPIAGVVNGVVVSGTADRIVVRDDQVDVVDFKTGRRVPMSAAQAPEYHKRQMAAYVAVLRGVFPDRVVRASLLYTAGPRLIVLTEDDLDRYKPGLQPGEQDLSRAG